MRRATLDWRARLRRDVGWLLLAKLIGLILLRSLFFSQEHRLEVDEPTLADRLALQASSPPPGAKP